MLVGFRGRNHPQQVALWGAIDTVDDRTTDPELFAMFDAEFGFTLDAAASSANARCPRFFTLEDDGLSQPWAGERVWCNPPYSNIAPWVEKAWLETAADVVAMLTPANRTEQRWWQEMIEPYRDQADSRLSVRFLPGRLRFIAPGAAAVGPNERPPFGCCLLIWQ